MRARLTGCTTLALTLGLAGALPATAADAPAVLDQAAGQAVARVVADASPALPAGTAAGVGALATAWAAPRIISPVTAQAQNGSFTAFATTDATGRFALVENGSLVGVGSSTAGFAGVRVSYPGAVSTASHTLSVAPCTGDPCAPGAITGSITVDVAPTAGVDVTGVSFPFFSPNGNSKQDTTKISYTTTLAGTVSVQVTRVSTGAVVRQATVGTRAAGSWSWTWNGKKDDGTRAVNGIYAVRVTVTAPGGESASDEARVTSDVSAPTVREVTLSNPTLFTTKDGYYDAVLASGTLNEPAALLTWEVANLSGHALHKASLGAQTSGVKKVSFDGENAAGYLLPMGRYRTEWEATDLAGNRQFYAGPRLVVDERVLQRRVGTKIVTPAAAAVAIEPGACSRVASDPNGWTGGHGYYSLWFEDHAGTCEDDGAPDLAVAEYKLLLPAAVRYGNVKVSATGRAHSTGSQGHLVVLRNDTSDPAATEAVLGSSFRSYSSTSVPLASLGFGRTVRWLGATVDGNEYDVKSFKVTWSYFVLVDLAG